MISIAIVENDPACQAALADYIRRYGQEARVAVDVRAYPDGLSFISDYSGGCDIVLLDIVMPRMDGLEVARRLREVDRSACLIFITTMAGLAIRGYEFNALDFLVKPVGYPLFSVKLARAVASLAGDERFTIPLANGMKRVRPSEITYIESDKHYLNLHTRDGEYRMRGSMRDIRDFFEARAFASTCNSILVNLAYVDEIDANTVSVQGARLPLVHRYKRELWNRMTRYIGGGQGGL